VIILITKNSLYSLIAPIFNPTAHSKLDQDFKKLSFSQKSMKFVHLIQFSVYHHSNKEPIFSFKRPYDYIDHKISLFSLIAHICNATAYSKLDQNLEKSRFSVKI